MVNSQYRDYDAEYANEKVTYKGNPKLKKASAEDVSLTQEQLDEYVKCENDPVYFAEKYVKVVHVDHGLMDFKPYAYQRKMMNHFHKNRFSIVKCPRQSGKTTSCYAFIIHQILFRENISVAILANKGQTARGILRRLQRAYEDIPKWLQRGVVTWNRGDIELSNGSTVLASATSGDSVRSGSFAIIMLDEFAHIENHIAEEFFTSTYPTISSGKETKVIIVSTPKGLNHFYKMWRNAEEGLSDYKPFSIHWSETPGRDEKWKDETIRNTSQEQFDQEFGAEFLGSSHTLISGSKLKSMTWKNHIRRENNFHILEQPVIPKLDRNGNQIDDGNTYVICVDVANGQNLDYSAFTVIDVSMMPYKVVAKYKNNEIAPLVYPNIIFHAARYYNNAYVLVEISNIGQQVADILHFELEYENLIKVMTKGKQGQIVSSGHARKIAFGVKTSIATKRIGCANLKTLVENNKLIIEDEDIISELTTFIAHKESFAADSGANDDLAMCLVLFGWFVSQKHFKDSIKNDVRRVLQHEQVGIIEDDLLPFGIIDNGINDPLADDREKALRRWLMDRKHLYPFDNYTQFDDDENWKKLNTLGGPFM